jgi:transcriptional regulator with XRE-family HTH domain
MAATLGKRIFGLRKAKRLSLKQLSARSGVDAGQISRYERNQTAPSIDSLAALARALDVTGDYLREGERRLRGYNARAIARRESQRAFFASRVLSQADQSAYQSVVDLPAAPATRQGWEELHDLITRFFASR